MGLSAKRKPSQQARLSPAFSSCLGVLWGEGRRPSPSLPPISFRMLQSVALHCSAALAPQGQSPPPSPSSFLAGSRLSPGLYWAALPSPGEPGQVGWVSSTPPGAGLHPGLLCLFRRVGPIAHKFSISARLGGR